MAKGFKKDGLDIVIWEFRRGFGRNGGRWAQNKLTKLATNQIKKRTVDDSTKFRKHMNGFKMPGTFRGGIAKINQTIDLFIEEYETTKAAFQKSWYLESDIASIERKLRFLESLIETEQNELQYERMLRNWLTFKQEVKLLEK